MIDQFVIGFKAQRWWGTLAAVDFFLGGTGAGCFLLSMYLGITPGMILGWIAVALGAVALLIDLGRPDRFIKAGSQVGRSWISRGVVLTGLFLVFGILRLASLGANSGLGTGIDVVVTLAGLGVMLYTGFLLSHSPSIPFWNTTMLPLLFALYGLTCGAGILLVLLPALGERTVDLRTIETAALSLLAASLVFLWIYLLTMASSTVAAKESVRMLVSGSLVTPFMLGVTLVGLVLPLVIAAYVYVANAGFGTSSPPLAVAGVLALVGGYLFRYSVLKAGVYPPILDL